MKQTNLSAGVCVGGWGGVVCSPRHESGWSGAFTPVQGSVMKAVLYDCTGQCYEGSAV